MANPAAAAAAAKVTIRLNSEGRLVHVDVDGHDAPVELVEERESEPTPSFGDQLIPRPWLAG
jgi:hypothetical protein